MESGPSWQKHKMLHVFWIFWENKHIRKSDSSVSLFDWLKSECDPGLVNVRLMKKCQALWLKPSTPELVLLQFSKHSFSDLIGKYHLYEQLIYYSVISVLLDISVYICQHINLKPETNMKRQMWPKVLAILFWISIFHSSVSDTPFSARVEKMLCYFCKPSWDKNVISSLQNKTLNSNHRQHASISLSLKN